MVFVAVKNKKTKGFFFLLHDWTSKYNFVILQLVYSEHVGRFFAWIVYNDHLEQRLNPW